MARTRFDWLTFRSRSPVEAFNRQTSKSFSRRLHHELLEERYLLTMSPWSPMAQPSAANLGEQIDVRATDYDVYALDVAQIRADFIHGSLDQIAVPNPDGSMDRFTVADASVMAPELAAMFPDIRTFRGQGIDDPTATISFDITPAGFHAQVLSSNGSFYIDPYYHLDDSVYAVYAANGTFNVPDFTECLDCDCGCGGDDKDTANANANADAPSEQVAAASESAGDLQFADDTGPGIALSPSGNVLRTFRIAVAATGEYTAFQGGTVALGQAAIVTAINRVSGIYETELSIRLQLVANNSQLVYTNAATDPYTNSNPSSLLSQNQSNLDSVIGSSNYDVGHVFSTGGGGLAGLGVVGRNGVKAQGETGLSAPTGDAFYVDYVAHELGHQFGGNHTFNGDSGSCSGANRNGSTAYEPGSGTTIMAYAGICGNDDLQPHSDPFFHSVSLDEIIRYVDVTIPTVGVRTSNGNSIPTVAAGIDYTIPTQTPFKVTAVGSDADSGDVLTYDWEERDVGPQIDLAAADNGTSPLFRSWVPSTDPSRTFPQLSNILSNTSSIAEKLPTVARTMNLRATVRDNRSGGGGVNSDDMIVHVVNTGAAFAITGPNTAISWPVQSSQTVTWNVAGTTANGINTALVNILLSTDGGLTFSTVLAAGTPNDGSQDVVLPNIQSTTARIKVEAVGNIFFDISNVNFTIGPPASTEDFGDAPTAAQSGFAASYPTLIADNGAEHTASGPRLGANRDTETNGQPSANADGDDTTFSPDDEDGVVLVGAAVYVSTSSTNQASVQVNLQNADATSNRLDAWIDFNRDGDWTDADEQIFANFDLGTSNGVQTLNFTVPQETGANVVTGQSYARFRLSTAGGLAPTGATSTGEVEDHAVNISVPQVVATQSGGSTDIVEGGATDTYALALATNPTGPVEITVTADSQSEVSLDGVNFAPLQVFARSDTSAQTITVRAIDDALIEGPHTATITQVITGTVVDSEYPLSLAISSVVVNIADNELAQFERVAPLGGLIFVSDTNSGTLASASSHSDFSFSAEGGQTIAASVAPLSSVLLSVELVGIPGTFTSATPGAAVVLPTTAIAADGTYTLRVTGSGATNFNLSVFRNAALEAQSGDTANGNELAIDDSLIAHGSGRYGVLGRSNAVVSSTLQFTKTNNPGQFIDISGSGTALNLADDGEANITTTVGNSIFPAGPITVANNGVIVAGSSVDVDYNNTAVPTTAFGRALLPFWDDIDSDTGNVYWKEQSVGGINTLIVQWENRPHYDNTGSGTFQLQLFASGPVLARYAYKDVDFGNVAYNFGATATIGYQASTTSAATFSFNTASIANGDVLDLAFPNTPDIDEYTINLTGKAGQPIDILLAANDGTNFAGQTLALLDIDGTTVLATAVSDPIQNGIDAENYELGVLDFVVPADGVYTLRFTSVVQGEYAIVVTDPLTFDTEQNDNATLDPLRDLTNTKAALGYLNFVSDQGDFYKIQLAQNQALTISTHTPFDSSLASPSNNLDPELQVIHPDGSTVVGTDLDSADGKNADLSFSAPVAGVYTIRVRATSGAGEYLLQVSDIPPPSLPGDYDQNENVDASDYVLWRKTAGATGVRPYSAADGSGNGSVGDEDYGVWRGNYGNVPPDMGRGGAAGLESATGVVEVTSFASVASFSEPQDVPTATANLRQRAGSGEVQSLEIHAQPQLLSVQAVPDSWGRRQAEPDLPATGHRPSRIPVREGINRDDALLAWLTSRGNSRREEGGVTLGVGGGQDGPSCDRAADDAFAELGVELAALV